MDQFSPSGARSFTAHTYPALVRIEMISTLEEPLNNFSELASQPRWEAMESQRALLLDELSQLEQDIDRSLQQAERECGIRFASGLPNTIANLEEGVLKRLFAVMNQHKVEVHRTKHIGDPTPGWSKIDTTPDFDPSTYIKELHSLKAEAEYFAENQPRNLKLIDASKYPIWPDNRKISTNSSRYPTHIVCGDLFHVPAHYLHQGVNHE